MTGSTASLERAPRKETAAKGPIAYISHYFPALTQTFVYREILALEALGWEIHPFSIRRPTKGISDEARDLAARTCYVMPPRPGKLLARQAAAFLRSPLRYLGLLLFVVTRPGDSLAARIHGLTHFFGGIYIVPELRRAGVRHIHAHFGMNPTTLAMVAAKYLGISFSMTIHARDLFVDTALLRTKLEEAKFVVTISEYNRKLLREMARTPEAAAKVRVVHCGIDPGRFRPQDGAIPAPGAGEPGAGDRRPVFLAVGRLVAKKGYRYLVDAARILKDRGVPLEVRVIGGGPDKEELARRIAELGVDDVVRLDGPMPQERLLPILRGADGFVLPCVQAGDGDRDGIPVSLMEAMACEVPCISTRISGIPELISDGEEGLLVPEKDPAALADAIERLARDPGIRRDYGRAGRKKVEAEFTLAVEAAELDRLFLA